MKRWWTLFLVGCGWWSGATAPTIDASHPRADREPVGGSPARDGAFQARIDRHELARLLTAASPRPRIYNVWATWCGPCVAEMPALDRFAEAHPEVDLWFVNTDHPKVASAQVDRFLVEHDLTDRLHLRPSADEPDLTAAVPDFPAVLPVTFVIRPSGERHEVFIGAVDEALLDRSLTTLAAHSP